MKLISHCLTPEKRLSGILSLIRFSNLSAPSLFSALPPVIYFEASPKAIPERTSYLRVRLEFLRYPHLIRYHFNGDVYKRQGYNSKGKYYTDYIDAQAAAKFYLLQELAVNVDAGRNSSVSYTHLVL